jgi:hypothetical protein
MGRGAQVGSAASVGDTGVAVSAAVGTGKVDVGTTAWVGVGAVVGTDVAGTDVAVGT